MLIPAGKDDTLSSSQGPPFLWWCRGKGKGKKEKQNTKEQIIDTNVGTATL